MQIRKIAVLGSFAAGAALALAPLASADDLTSTVESEISALNAIFESEAATAGDSGDVVSHAGSFDTIPLADAPQTAPFTALDTELYGINPAGADPSPAPGSYDVFNGALIEFDDAYNAALYSLLNVSNLIPADDLIGSSTTIDAALATGSDAGAFTTFFDAGEADLFAYFDLPSL